MCTHLDNLVFLPCQRDGGQEAAGERVRGGGREVRRARGMVGERARGTAGERQRARGSGREAAGERQRARGSGREAAGERRRDSLVGVLRAIPTDLQPRQGAGGRGHARGGTHVDFTCACLGEGVSGPVDGGRGGGVPLRGTLMDRAGSGIGYHAARGAWVGTRHVGTWAQASTDRVGGKRPGGVREESEGTGGSGGTSGM